MGNTILSVLRDPCGKSYPNEIGKRRHLMGRENEKQSQFDQIQDFKRKTKDKKIENKANPPSADKFLSYYLTSKYVNFVPFVAEKKKPILVRLKMQDYRLKINGRKLEFLNPKNGIFR